MISRISLALTIICIIIIVTVSCTHDPQLPKAVDDGGYPPEIAKILVTRCTMSGCHNQASYKNASGLLLDTWDHLFNGNDFGASVIPYWPQYSPLLFFVNPDSSLGPILRPQMPLNGTAPALTKDEYNTLYNWVKAGAPDKNGNIPFASNMATRQKIYALCNDYNVDLIAVIDGERKVVMRYIKVGGSDAQEEDGHDMVPSSDGSTLYESFVNGSVLQKVDMLNDVSLGTAELGKLGWALLCLSPDDSKVMVTNWSDAGIALSVKSNPFAQDLAGSFSPMNYPHGIKANATFDTFFVTANHGNCMYKCYDLTEPGNKHMISLDGNPPSDNLSTGRLGPHAMWMAPDYSKYFVTCETSDEVRVMDAHTDTLIAVIPVGHIPQEIEAPISDMYPYVFVTCRDDSNASTPKFTKGSVYVINRNTYAVTKVIYGDFYQPHGITVDNRNNAVYVFSLNANGPVQHHAINNHRDGWYTIIDLTTLTPTNKHCELLSNPYEGTTRFEN